MNDFLEWLKEELIYQFEAEHTGLMIYGDFNFEIVWVEDVAHIYPSKGYFPREQGTFGAGYTGEPIILERRKHGG